MIHMARMKGNCDSVEGGGLVGEEGIAADGHLSKSIPDTLICNKTIYIYAIVWLPALNNVCIFCY